MRIATWNLAGRWTAAHLELIERVDADVWLFTEVSDRLAVPNHAVHATAALMARRRRWAAVAARVPVVPLPDPHAASAAAIVGDIMFVSSILPWRGAGGLPPWKGAGHAERTANCLAELRSHLSASQLAWGGDWNHALSGPEVSGSVGGRAHLRGMLDRLELVVPTADLGRSADRASIDHIAVGAGVCVEGAHRVDHGGLSDHDAYVVDVAD